MEKCENCPVADPCPCPAHALPCPRYCALLAMGRADYAPVILALAGRPPAGPPVPAPSPDEERARRRAGKPRVALGVDQRRH